MVSSGRFGRSGEVEHLEPRTLLNATLVKTPRSFYVPANSGATTLNLNNYFTDPTVVGTAINIQTPLGSIPLTLFDSRTPNTVANFKNYITTPGEYDQGTIIHRSVPGFIIQGGGFTTDGNQIPTFSSPTNEPGISNTTGTIAMAKLGGDPNSATDQWFINLADNSSNLDKQNGGFTVFGQVIYNGMSVANAIANLPTVDDSQNPPGASGGQDIWSNLPVNNYTGSSPTTTFVPPANMVTTSISIVSALTFGASTTNNQLVVPAISADGTLTLTYMPGQTGTATIDLSANDLGSGIAATSSFTVQVGGTPPGPTVTLGKGGARVIKFTDPNGAAGTATLAGPGSAAVSFIGFDLTTSAIKAGVETITGTPQSISFATTGTTAGSALNINGSVSLAGITTDANIGSISGSRATLAGDLTAAGTVGTVNLAAANSGTISVGAAGRSLNLRVGSASGESVSSSGAIASISAKSWTNGGTMTATSINHIADTGELNAEISTPALGFVTAGSITTSTWSISGKLTGVSAGSISGLNLSAGLIGPITDRGAAQGDVIDSTGNIGAVTALSMSGTRIEAGVDSADANGLATAFSANDKIASVVIGKGGFSNSVMDAETLSHVNLGTLSSSNGGVPFGLASSDIVALTAIIDGERVTISRATSADVVTAALARAGVTLTDMVIRIV